MEKHHNDVEEIGNNAIRALFKAKKEKRNAVIPAGAPIIKITEEERPETIADATKMARKILVGQQ